MYTVYRCSKLRLKSFYLVSFLHTSFNLNCLIISIQLFVSIYWININNMIQEFVEECSITKIIIYYWLTNNIKHVNKLLSKITRLYMMIITRNIIDLSSNPFEKYFPYSLLPVKSVLDVIIKIFFYTMLVSPWISTIGFPHLFGEDMLFFDYIHHRQYL